ncbi:MULTISPECIES: sugar transferase [unclassified Pseudoalteromonas]|uniref:sugar transferase n=1 Tax=unclassified Pseudoalteromonas TaxID=194690 RepID=UPI000C073E4E|nr:MULTISPECIES: sugar transferase [unclassified Pseudoalteromonas]MDP2636854.1 sugar transferase [Pseudoalteromonas sp. 1_MG-2023]PHN88696.1 exopolysaccharide biosynthesis protein [Pseudoalteromonas sp. 3D05]
MFENELNHTDIRVLNRFKSSSEALKQNTIYLYCPESVEPLINKLATNYDFDIKVNDYSLKDLSKQVICHYQVAELSLDQRHYLVVATELGAWVEPLVSYLDARFGYTEVALLHSSYFLHQKAFSILSHKRTQFAKRVVDIVAAFLLSLIALPVGLITALLIKLESPGTVFYKQKRTGQYNEEFYVIKFRSMSKNAESTGAQWASKNDSRVTRVGQFIRRTRIDELPQIINILKGEMSIVGPRPEREIFIDSLEKEIPYYRFRHAVKPGITGLAQISYPYGASTEDAIWKHKYDIHYIKHHSTWLDIKILVKTVKVVLFGMGR